MSVPEGARLGMPIKDYFWEKTNFLEEGPAKALIDGRLQIPNITKAQIKKMAKKCHSYFGLYPDIWDVSIRQSTGKYYSELQSFNCFLDLSGKISKWIWAFDRQISGFIWLNGSDEDLVEFPYLKENKEDEPKKLKPKARKIVLFPSHPMYAFKLIPQEKEIFFLEIHATLATAPKPKIEPQEEYEDRQDKEKVQISLG